MDEQYLIHEVAEKAGVSTRTIRYYITEGCCLSLPTAADMHLMIRRILTSSA